MWLGGDICCIAAMPVFVCTCASCTALQPAHYAALPTTKAHFGVITCHTAQGLRCYSVIRKQMVGAGTPLCSKLSSSPTQYPQPTAHMHGTDTQQDRQHPGSIAGNNTSVAKDFLTRRTPQPHARPRHMHTHTHAHSQAQSTCEYFALANVPVCACACV
jgi:hypothetical protein